MDKKLREITNLGVEMMNSKRQVKRKLVGSRSTNSRLPFDMKHDPQASHIGVLRGSSRVPVE